MFGKARLISSSLESEKRQKSEGNLMNPVEVSMATSPFSHFKPSLDFHKHFKTKISKIGPAFHEF